MKHYKGDSLSRLTIRAKATIAASGAALSALLLVGCASAAASTLKLPITFQHFQDDPQLVQSQTSAGSPAFDARNVAYYRLGPKLIRRWPDGHVETFNFQAAVSEAISRDILHQPGAWDGHWDVGQSMDTRIVFDDSDTAYTTITPRYSNVNTSTLLYSTDHCATWHARRLKGIVATLESRDSFNSHAAPPMVLSFNRYGAGTDGHLWLEPFRMTSGGLVSDGAPALVSATALLVPNHSGGANSTFTLGRSVFVVYPSALQPRGGFGTEALIRQYDLATHQFTSPPRDLGVQADLAKVPAKTPDPHAIPAISADASGRLYVVLGTHQGLFKLTMSNASGDISHGFSPPEPIGQMKLDANRLGTFTYLGMVMTQDQTLNLFTRAEGDYYHFQLVQMQKPFNQPFRTWDHDWIYRVIAEPGRNYYGAWRQKVTFDRKGAMYLYFVYWPNQLSSDEAQALNVPQGTKGQCIGGHCFYPSLPFLYPTTLVSYDGGQTFSEWAHGRDDQIDAGTAGAKE